MNRLLLCEVTICIGLGLLITGCARSVTAQENAEANAGPTPIKVVPDFDPSIFQVDHPEQFPLAAATVDAAAAPSVV